jgi:hypothetical protein
MKDLFTQLHGLVHDRLSPEKMSTSPENRADQALLVDCTKKLPGSFSTSVIDIDSKESMTLLVWKAQANTSVLLTKLAEYQQAIPWKFYLEAEQLLIDFIIYLRKHYTRYFDFKITMPERMWQADKDNLERKLAQLRNAPEQGIDAELYTLVHTAFEEVKQGGPLSFIASHYWRSLLQKLCSLHDLYDTETAFIHTLIACNFNSDLFIQYVFKRAEDENFASRLRKNLWHIPETSNLALHRRRPSCKQQFIDWIFVHTAEMNGLAATKRMEVSLSVSQLGVLLWLLVDAEIIRTDNVNELTRLIAGSVRTSKTAAISPDSLHKHYYTRPMAARSIMRSMLRNMQQRLNSLLPFSLALLTDVTEGLYAACVTEPYLALI